MIALLPFRASPRQLRGKPDETQSKYRAQQLMNCRSKNRASARADSIEELSKDFFHDGFLYLGRELIFPVALALFSSSEISTFTPKVIRQAR